MAESLGKSDFVYNPSVAPSPLPLPHQPSHCDEAKPGLPPPLSLPRSPPLPLTRQRPLPLTTGQVVAKSIVTMAPPPPGLIQPGPPDRVLPSKSPSGSSPACPSDERQANPAPYGPPFPLGTRSWRTKSPKRRTNSPFS